MRFLNIWFLMFVLSAFMATMLSLGIPELLKARELVRQGSLVEVQVVRGTDFSFGKRHAYHLQFRYAGQQHAIQVGRDYLARVEVLKSTKLLHQAEYPDTFLQPGYDASGQLSAGIGLVGFFVFLTVFSGIKFFRNRS